MSGFPKRNGCEECIVYKIHHNLAEPEICPECGHKSLYWKQSRGGSLLVRCSRCWLMAAVELNTPCECDPIFYESTKLVIEPQIQLPGNRIILHLAKTIHVRGLQMRSMLMDGCVLYLETDKMDVFKEELNTNNICYRIIDPKDPREKYPYYMHCHYTYSGMRKYLPEIPENQSNDKELNEKSIEPEIISLDGVYERLCELIPENKELCENHVSVYGLDYYGLAFSCIFQPMIKSYEQNDMELFRKYSEFVEYVMDHGEELIAQAIGDEVIDRLELDESADVWKTFRQYTSKSFNY